MEHKVTLASEMTSEQLARGAEAGNAPMMCELARRLAEGRGVSRDMDQARRWYEMAAESDDAFVKVIVGDQYERGTRLRQDCGRAEELYLQADASRLPFGAYALGRLYANYLGQCPGKYDPARSRACLLRAIKDRHVTALLLLLALSLRGEFGIIGRLVGGALAPVLVPYMVWTLGRKDAYRRWSGWRDFFAEDGRVARRIKRSIPNDAG